MCSMPFSLHRPRAEWEGLSGTHEDAPQSSRPGHTVQSVSVNPESFVQICDKNLHQNVRQFYHPVYYLVWLTFYSSQDVLHEGLRVLQVCSVGQVTYAIADGPLEEH